MKIDWKNKQVWKHRTETHCVEVHYWQETPADYMRNRDGGNRWNVYAYFYKTHAHFKAFDLSSDSMFQDAAIAVPIHGHSMLEYHRNKTGDICSIQVGGDYNHLHDDRFTFMDDSEFEIIERDAIALIAWMQENK